MGQDRRYRPVNTIAPNIPVLPDGSSPTTGTRSDAPRNPGMPVPPPQTPPAGPNPWAQWGLDPTRELPAGVSGPAEQAMAGLQYAAQQALGRQLTEQQLNEAARAAGYSGSGPVSADQYNRALAWVNSLRQAAPPPGGPTPPPAPPPGGWGGFPGTPPAGPVVQPPPAYQPGGPAPSVGQPGYTAPTTLPAGQLPGMPTAPGQLPVAQAPGQMPGAPAPGQLPTGPATPAPLPGAMPGQQLGTGPTVSPWQNPAGMAGSTNLQSNLLNSILSGPQTLTPDAINQLKMQGKEQALSIAEQLRGSARGDLASRGFSGAGGAQLAADAAVDNQLIDSLINSNRDIDLMALERNREDQLNALQIADSVLSGQMSRGSEGFRNTLAGTQLQEDINMGRADFGERQRMFDSEFGLDASRLGEEQRQFDFGANLDRSRLGEEQRQFDFGADLDRSRFGEDIRRFDSEFGLDTARLGEDQRQFDAGFGLDRARLGEDIRMNDADYGLRRADQDEERRRFDSDFGLRSWEADNENRRDADDRAFRNQDFLYGQTRDDREMSFNEWMGRTGADLDNRRLAEDTRRFDRASQLDLLRFLEGRRQFDTGFGEDQRQFDNTLARGYYQDNINQQNGLLNYLMGLFGGR